MEDWLSYLTVAHSGSSYLWATPLGLICIVLIIVCSFLAIFSKKADSDFPTIVYNWALVMVCSGSVIHILENTDPKQQLQALLVAIAAKKIWNTFLIFRKEKKLR